MVKLSRAPRVWQAPQVKQRKKRITKQQKQKMFHAQPEEVMPEKVEIQQPQQQPLKGENEIKSKSRDSQKQRKARAEEDRKIRQLIKDCLFDEKQMDISINQGILASERAKQKKAIDNFIDTQLVDGSQSEILYIYGSPGIGKTYLIRNTLIEKEKWEQTVWVNCFTIISKAKIESSFIQYHQNSDLSQQKIVVLDQFDQLQQWLNSSTFVEKFKSFLHAFGQNVKYIMISNKSIHSFDRKPNELLKGVISYRRIFQIPFLPLDAIKKIVGKKIQIFQNQSASLAFDSKLIAIAIIKIYSTTQDIRKVLAFILDNYQLLLKHQDDHEAEQLLRKRTIDELTKNKHDKQQAQSLECSYLKNLRGPQKTLLKNIIIEYEQTVNNNKSYLSMQTYRQGRKLGISRHTVDLWLQEWMEMGILTRKHYVPKDQFIFQQTYVIRPKLSMSRYKSYFY